MIIIKELQQLILLIVCTVMVGCVGNLSEVNRKTAELVSVTPVINHTDGSLQKDLDLLLDDQCVLFQWQSLIPRKTAAVQVLWALTHNPAIVDFEVYDNKEVGENGIAEISGFYQTVSNPSKQLRFRIVFLEDPRNNVVDVVLIEFDNSIPLGEVVERCGEPSHIFAMAEYGEGEAKDSFYWDARFFWVERGLIVLTSGKENPPPPINENLKLNDYLELMAPSEEVIKQRWIQFVPWEGYQDFEYYHVEVE